MENEAQVVVVKKENRFWKVVKVLLVLAAIGFVAVKVYNKFFRKKNELLDAEDEEDMEALAEADEIDAEDDAEEPTFEASADAVLDSAEEDIAQ
jgi:flagellar biosynthesis/type III secretory pathway M-ring protein FliF/YscJ